MSERKDADLIADLLNAGRRIRDYLRGMSFREFEKDLKTQDAVIRNLEVIGEAVKLLSEEFKRKHPEVPWKHMAGMRDVIIHRYFGF